MTFRAEPDTWRLGHRPSLDGLRGIAVLLVLVGHIAGVGDAGIVGVAIFFALSGYLISGLLLGELETDGRVSLAGFYVRRARRLLPAFAVLLVGVGLAQILTGSFATWLVGATSVALYVANWAHIAGVPMQGLEHTWSLAVEEQFYLAWPVTMLLFLRAGGRFALLSTLAVVLLSFALTAATLHDGTLPLYGTQARVKDLLMGAGLAMLAMQRGRDLVVPTWLAAIAAAAVLPIVFLEGLLVSPLLVSLPSAVLVAWAATRSEVLSWRWLRFTGRISYGLYLYHLPLVTAAAAIAPEWPLCIRVPVLFAASYAVAAASWFLVERRIVARSTRLEGRDSELSTFPRPPRGVASAADPALARVQ